jgi:hypothetical protein
MAASTPPVPGNPTGQLAQYLPAYDPTPGIAVMEQSLGEYLSRPLREILAELDLLSPDAAQPPAQDPKQDPEQAPDPAGQGNPFDPSSLMGLIQPVTDALGTLGSGQFGNPDPTKAFDGISNTFDDVARSLQPALGSLAQDLQGETGTAAAAKTLAALANGQEVGMQSAGLSRSLSTAAADVAQTRARLIAIIAEFQATLAAIGPNIIFPWGWAAVIAAATKAITMATEAMTELQGTLGAEAATVSAIGAPVPVTAAPQLASMVGPMMQMIGPMAQAGTGLISSLTQAATQASQANEAGKPDGKPDPRAAAGGGGPMPAAAGGGGAGGAVGGGAAGGVGGGAAGGVGAGGAGGAAALRQAAPLPPMQTSGTTAAATPVSAARPAMGGVPMGGGMMGAPMAGAGHGGGANSAHTAAAYLQTSDQGGEIVGDLGTVAPPVVGEADPHDTPDIELRI